MLRRSGCGSARSPAGTRTASRGAIRSSLSGPTTTCSMESLASSFVASSLSCSRRKTADPVFPQRDNRVGRDAEIADRGQCAGGHRVGDARLGEHVDQSCRASGGRAPLMLRHDRTREPVQRRPRSRPAIPPRAARRPGPLIARATAAGFARRLISPCTKNPRAAWTANRPSPKSAASAATERPRMSGWPSAG